MSERPRLVCELDIPRLLLLVGEEQHAITLLRRLGSVTDTQQVDTTFAGNQVVFDALAMLYELHPDEGRRLLLRYARSAPIEMLWTVERAAILLRQIGEADEAVNVITKWMHSSAADDRDLCRVANLLRSMGDSRNTTQLYKLVLSQPYEHHPVLSFALGYRLHALAYLDSVDEVGTDQVQETLAFCRHTVHQIDTWEHELSFTNIIGLLIDHCAATAVEPLLRQLIKNRSASGGAHPLTIRLLDTMTP